MGQTKLATEKHKSHRKTSVNKQPITGRECNVTNANNVAKHVAQQTKMSCKRCTMLSSVKELDITVLTVMLDKFQH